MAARPKRNKAKGGASRRNRPRTWRVGALSCFQSQRATPSPALANPVQMLLLGVCCCQISQIRLILFLSVCSFVLLLSSDQSYASSVSRADSFLQISTPEQGFRSSFGGLGYSPPRTSPLEEGTEGRPLSPDVAVQDVSLTGRAAGDMGGGGGALTISTNRGFEASESFQDEGCSVS